MVAEAARAVHLLVTIPVRVLVLQVVRVAARVDVPAVAIPLARVAVLLGVVQHVRENAQPPVREAARVDVQGLVKVCVQ